MKKLLFYTIFGTLGLFSASCDSGHVAEVKPAISDSVMIQVLIELHLAEARVQMFKEDSLSFRDSVLAQYSITVEDFDANMSYYHDHPDALHELYTRALDGLSDERYMQGNDAKIEQSAPTGQ